MDPLEGVMEIPGALPCAAARLEANATDIIAPAAMHATTNLALEIT
jgi:hypothetical protein